jgi:hypothetical protein
MMFSKEETEPTHSHWMEYLLKIVPVICNMMFVVGCYCFYSASNSVYGFGDWFFIAACLIDTVLAIYDFIEALHEKSITAALSGTSQGRDEVLETGFFVLGNICFASGCVFFLPSVKDMAGFSSTSNAIGAWLCIAGSFALVYGTFYSATCFENEPGDSALDDAVHTRCRQLSKLSINLTLVGVVFFTVGSFMYRPVFGGLCPPRSSNAICEAVSTYGTTCYLYGSYLFVAASVLGLITTIIKANNEAAEKPTEKTKLMA